MNQNSIIGNHIFIVEDDVVMQYVLKRIFSNTCLVTMFGNGLEALRALQSGVVPDLVITDLNIPLLNGMELLQTMKADAELCDIPVMIMSADHSISKKEKCFLAGADDYLQKPFQAQDLRHRVKNTIEKACDKMRLMHA